VAELESSTDRKETVQYGSGPVEMKRAERKWIGLRMAFENAQLKSGALALADPARNCKEDLRFWFGGNCSAELRLCSHKGQSSKLPPFALKLRWPSKSSKGSNFRCFSGQRIAEKVNLNPLANECSEPSSEPQKVEECWVLCGQLARGS
jgi:hypothetical protein